MKTSRLFRAVISLVVVLIWAACLGAFTTGVEFIDDSKIELQGWWK